MRIILGFIFSAVLFICSFSPSSRSALPVMTFALKDSALYVGSVRFEKADKELMKKLLGKPDRSLKHKHTKTMRRWEANEDGSKGPCQFYKVELTDYYYIWDNYGLMLYTNNSHGDSPEPHKLLLYFGHKRTFTNTEAFPYFPKNAFGGIMTINGDTLLKKSSPVPSTVNYRTENFRLYGTNCSSSSTGTCIDRIFASGQAPRFVLYLNNEKEQKTSFVEIF